MLKAIPLEPWNDDAHYLDGVTRFGMPLYEDLSHPRGCERVDDEDDIADDRA